MKNNNEDDTAKNLGFEEIDGLEYFENENNTLVR